MALDTRLELSDRLRTYLEAWVGLDPTAVRAAYTPDATHRGPGVVQLAPERADATLRGGEQIEELVRRLVRFVDALTYRVVWIQETDSASVVEYEYTVPGRERPGLIAEVIEWEGDRARSVRGYTLAAPG